MRILFLSLMSPLPANNGHRMRVLDLLQALAADSHDVSLITFRATDELDDSLASLNRLCRDVEAVPFHTRPLTAGGDYLRRLSGLLASQPFAVRRYVSPAMRERVRRHLARETFDAIVVDSVFGLVNLPPTAIPVVLNNVDLEHRILERYARQAANPAKRLYAWLESRKVKRWEIAECRRSTVAMACSEHDRTLLRQWCPDLPVVTVPNVVDTASYVPVRDGHEAGILYQGAMDYYPNRDAVEFFVTSILAEVRKVVPDAPFRVVGRNPSEALRRRLARVAGVELTGTVPDMRPFVAGARVCVVPLRIGSGTRLKILEAAAMAKPIVSTRLGAEGLGFVDGEDIVLADEPLAFAQAVARLLTDGAERARLGAAARCRVEREYSPAVLRAGVRSALTLAVSEAVPGGRGIAALRALSLAARPDSSR